MVASKAKYHKACMTNLANRYRTVLGQGLDAKMNDEGKKNKARAWVELICYMESCVDDGKYMWPLTELHQMYVKRLQTFGIEKQVNKTSLSLRGRRLKRKGKGVKAREKREGRSARGGKEGNASQETIVFDIPPTNYVCKKL